MCRTVSVNVNNLLMYYRLLYYLHCFLHCWIPSFVQCFNLNSPLIRWFCIPSQNHQIFSYEIWNDLDWESFYVKSVALKILDNCGYMSCLFFLKAVIFPNWFILKTWAISVKCPHQQQLVELAMKQMWYNLYTS